jgi:subtilisin-like proprotein convertase family protein
MRSIFTCLLSAISACCFSQTFTASPNATINDNATTEYNLVVSGLSPANIDTANFGLESVCINLTHTWDSDLNIFIVAPDGTTSSLTMGQGGSDDNYTNTCFNAFASGSIATGLAPFTGVFRPMGEMGRVNNGQNGNGLWKLRVVDTYPADNGTMLSFSVTFGSNPAPYTPFVDSNLPIVVINTNNQTIPDDPQIMADMGIIYNGVGNRNHMADPFNHYNGKAGIEVRGNYSASLPQKPYRFETWDVNANSVNVPLLGMPSENDWCLLATYNDKSFVRTALAFNLFESMGHYAPRSVFVEVVLNGEYQGVYQLCETIKRDNNRVDIATLNTTDITGTELTGGYIIKTDYWDNSNSWQTSYSPLDAPTQPIRLVYHYPDDDEIVAQQKAYIQSFIYDMETALYGPNFTDSANGYRKYMSVRSFMDYFFVNELARNVDGFKKSCYYYKEKDDSAGNIGKLKAGPVWDFDWAWKDIWDCSIFQATDGSGWSHQINSCGPDNYSPGWMLRMLQDTSFANELNCRWQELRGTVLDTTYLFHYIDSVAAWMNESQARHYSYWGHMGANTGTPEVQPPRQSYQEEVDSLKLWILRRLDWLDANMFGNAGGCNLTSVSAAAASTVSAVAYPNPFANEITLQVSLQQSNEVQVRLFNPLGQEVITPLTTQGRAGANTIHVPVPADLTEGVYLLRVVCGENVWTQNIVKAK